MEHFPKVMWIVDKGTGFKYVFPGGSESEESACNAGGPCSIPGSGRSPGGGDGNPLQYFCLGNPMDGGAWRAAVHRIAKSRTRLKQLRLPILKQGIPE